MAGPARLVVVSQYGNISGGYCISGKHDGRDAYKRDNSHGGDSTWIFHESSFRGGARWYFGRSLPAGRALSSFFASKGDAVSPDVAIWPDEHVEIVQACPDGGVGRAPTDSLFKDKDFPHNNHSIGDVVKTPPDVCWIPCRQLRQGTWELFDGINPRDLLQGQLGNCWLVAAMSCLAEFEPSVKKLFRAQDERHGRYVLKLFDHTKDRFTEVVVDEFVPCHPRRWWDLEGKPLFARPNGNEKWCLLLEKAMAKMFGSYAELVGGHPATAFRAFTGEKDTIAWQRGRRRGGKWTKMTLMARKTTFEYNPIMPEQKSSEKLFDTMQQYDMRNYMVGASINGSRDVAEYRRPDGLVEGHSYAVLHAIKFEHFQMLCLRNPWGSDQEWNGDWSDKSPLWDQHPVLKHRLRPESDEEADSAKFWMSWKDFSQVFETVYVCCQSMRVGVDAEKHAEAVRVGSIAAVPEVLASMRRPPAPSHPERPPPRRLEAVAEEDGGGGESPRPHRPAPLQPGQRAEYHSETHDMWIPTRVLHYHERSRTYDLECKMGAEASRVRALQAFAVGDEVEYFSRSHGCWIKTQVLKYNSDRNTYDLQCKAGALEDCLRKPGGQRRRHRSPAVAPQRPTYVVNEHVQYQSESMQRWIDARILKLHTQEPLVDLDVKPGVPLEKIRKSPTAEARGAASPGRPKAHAGAAATVGEGERRGGERLRAGGYGGYGPGALPIMVPAAAPAKPYEFGLDYDVPILAFEGSICALRQQEVVTPPEDA